MEARLTEPKWINENGSIFGSHVKQQLANVSDVLPLDRLSRDLGKTSDSQQDRTYRQNLLLRYFYSVHSDAQTYFPIRVFEKEWNELGELANPKHAKQSKSLTDLLLETTDESYGHPSPYQNLVLIAQSGAGKTVACRKAFWDCLAHHENEGAPLLAGYIPCWIKLGSRTTAKDLLSQLLQQTAGHNESVITHEELEQQLELGPMPLLFFIDLNPLPGEKRHEFAKAITEFTNDERFRRHRVVVTYRSLERFDNTVSCLAAAGYRFFDMAMVNLHQAEIYLRGIREFQTFVHDAAGVSHESGDSNDEECQKLGELVRKQTLISTPFLMHIVSSLSGSELANVDCLSALYDQVVKRFLEQKREASAQQSETMPSDEWLEVAMTRIALVMLSEGVTSIEYSKADDLLRNPDSCRDKPWWPLDEFWTMGPDGRQPSKYYHNSGPDFGKSTKQLLKHGLLKADDSQVSFIHDSFQYYFAANSLRFFYSSRQPERIPEGYNWPVRLANRLAREMTASGEKAGTLRWLEPCQFLGNHLTSEDLQSIVIRLAADRDALETRGRHIVALGLLQAAKVRDEVCEAILSGIVRYRSSLKEHPHLFSTTLSMSVMGSPRQTDQLNKFYVRLAVAMKKAVTGWAKCVMAPSTNPAVSVMDQHSDVIYCLAVATDGKVASGSRDETVRLWDPETGQVDVMDQHSDVIVCVAVATDGKVVSGSRDKTVRLWDPETGQVEVMDNHSSDVNCVAVTADGKVVCGSDDNTVRLWDPETGRVEVMDQHSDVIHCVAVATDGKVVSGSRDKTVRLWDPETGQVEVMDNHSSDVNCVAVTADGKVVSGSDYGSVRLWDPETGQVKVTEELSAYIECVAVLNDGIVASICDINFHDYIFRLWDPKTDQVSVKVMVNPHSDTIECVALASDGKVVSGSWDKTVRLWGPELVAGENTVRLWDPKTRQISVIGQQHSGAVDCVTVTADGKVATGGRDSTVRFWDLKTGQVKVMDQHSDSIFCVAATPNGKVVSGSRDNTVRLWDPKTGQVKVDHYSDCFFCAAVTADGKIVSGSRDGTVRLWDPETGQVEVMKEHSQEIKCVAVMNVGDIVSVCYDSIIRWDEEKFQVLEDEAVWNYWDSVSCIAVTSDGKVVTGGRDDVVRRWDLETDQVEVMDQHSGEVDCVAVSIDGGVVSGSWDKTVRLWKAETSEVAVLVGTNATALGIASKWLGIVSDGKLWSFEVVGNVF